jgi:hypothetical protein
VVQFNGEALYLADMLDHAVRNRGRQRVLRAARLTDQVMVGCGVAIS